MTVPRRARRLRILQARLLADAQEHTGTQAGDLRRLLRGYLAPYGRTILIVFAALIAWASVPYFFALTHRYLIDRVLAPGAEGPILAHDRRLGLLLGLWLVFIVNMLLHTIGQVCNWITSRFTLRVGQGVAVHLREQLHAQLDDLHLAFYDRTQSGRIVARIQNDVAQVQNTITGHLAHLLVEPLKLVVGFAVLFAMDWRLARILAFAAPVYAVVFLVLRPLIRRNSTAHSRLVSRMYGRAAERLGAIQVVTAFGRERSELAAFAGMIHDGVRLGQRNALYSQGLSFAAATISTLATASVLWYGLGAVRDQAYPTTLGSVVAFVQLTGQVFVPIQTLTALAAVFQSARVSLRRIFALLDEPHRAVSGHIRLTGMSGKIRFDEVTFKYPTQAQPALRSVSFSVAPGERIAVMGPSGAGKSTLLNLILRFYEPQKGAIYVGGVSLADTDTASLRRHVRYVQQEPFLFSGSIADNIRYGTPAADEKDVADAARLVEMHEFIMGLPAKYDTEIGENGVGLSGGQRQRLALATALLTRPEILLLDDTTSALDARTEARIRETLNRVLAGRTSLIITQRIATARTCDRILVLEGGALTQAGTHEDLAGRTGFYLRILQQQTSA